MQKEISKQTGQNLGGKIMKDGSVTFGWFVRNRYYPLRDWRPETEKVKKIQIERDLVEKFDSVSLEAFEQFTLQKHLKHLATLEPSSQPPLLGAGPLRTGRDGFPSSGSGPLNASFGETR